MRLSGIVVVLGCRLDRGQYWGEQRTHHGRERRALGEALQNRAELERQLKPSVADTLPLQQIGARLESQGVRKAVIRLIYY